jgi:hypothetical protein
MTDGTFTHEAINDAIDEIRLVALQPSTDPTAAIKCKIFHARLSDCPPYEALSYMWGSDADSRIIRIERKEYIIGHNLWLALKQLRQAENERIVWIDAICINQTDTSERNHQVA